MPYSRTVLVTGGTAGLGYWCALDIAKKHPDYQIVISSRSDKQSAAESINKTLKQENVMFLPLDLSSLDNVRSYVKNWEAKNFPPIQYLLLNAGLQFPDGIQYTGDGLEATFGVNHVGHALLLLLLFSHLATDARIILTSSGTHDPAQKSGMPDAKYDTAEELAHPTAESIAQNDGRQRYSTSKLANMLFTYALSRRFQNLPGKSLSVAAFDPGLMPGTGLAREYSKFMQFLWNHVLPRIIPLLRVLYTPNIHLPEESGANLAWVATTIDAKEMNGYYFEGKKKISSSVASYDEAKQDDLWQWTVNTLAANDEERKAFSLL